MWVCLKCGREFRRNNQGHFCGQPPKTVDEYIEQQEPSAQDYLNKIREIIRQNAPEAVERIAWSMPIFERNGKSLSFAACQKHISFYVGAEVIEHFQADLAGFESKKSAIYLPYAKELPVELLAEIVKWYLGN